MKIAVFMTGWNSEYLQYLYKGLEIAQKDFKDEISAYTCFAQLGSGESFDKSEFDFFQLADTFEDEFIVITTENSGVDAEVIRRSMAEMCTDQDLEDGVEISIGVVVAKWDDPENMMSFLKKADKAMYEEKKLFHENCGTKENDK